MGKVGKKKSLSEDFFKQIIFPFGNRGKSGVTTFNSFVLICHMSIVGQIGIKRLLIIIMMVVVFGNKQDKYPIFYSIELHIVHMPTENTPLMREYISARSSTSMYPS